MDLKTDRPVDGPCEVEVCYAGEADLRRDLADCEKNPGHHRFIPVDEFNLNSLPPGYQDSGLVEYVRALSDVTVRVDVRYVSPARPETFPDSDQPYPRYWDGGLEKLGIGTGWVSKVEYLGSFGSGKFKKCRQRETTKQAAYIHIITVSHVVFDQLEAAQTTCHLFFDRGRSPELCENTVTLVNASKIKNDIARDWCEMTYKTYDLDLAHQLDKLLTRLQELQDSSVHNFRPNRSMAWFASPRDGPIDNPQDALTIIVSHPHGCSKQISIGNCAYLSVTEDEWTKYTYTTATCPGSSGAPVFVLGRDQRWWWWSTHAHCGNCKHDKELNYSTHTPSGVRFL